MVNPAQRRAWIASAQHGDLVTEHQDFGFLGRVGSGEQSQPAQTRASARYVSRRATASDPAGGVRAVTVRSAGREGADQRP